MTKRSPRLPLSLVVGVISDAGGGWPLLGRVECTYDSLDGLASTAQNNGTIVYYTYDQNGNRLVQAVSTSKLGSFNWGAANW